MKLLKSLQHYWNMFRHINYMKYNRCTCPPSAYKQIPKGWFVFEMGQSLVHMLWFVNLLEAFPQEGAERKQIFVEEYDTPDEALLTAIKLAGGESE